MGFYGHITNVQRTSMSFDRIYPNRFTMDERAGNDGVYAGRYVLVEYDQPLDAGLLPRMIQFDGILYQPPPVRQNYDPNDADPNSAISYLVKLIPYTINMEQQDDVNDTTATLKSDIIVVCSAGDNLGLVYRDEQQAIEPVSRLQYFRVGKINNAEKESYNLLYNYKTQRFQLDAAASREKKIGCAYTEVNYAELISEDKSNHLLNFNVDASKYPTSRGYDSTVWQKTYIDGSAKYVMIAELNSVVPILDVSADAPTLAPVMPHFDKDSTNIYYKLHMQPTWGFRIKAADPMQKIPTLDYSGSKISDGTGIDILATTTSEAYPSDQKIQWINTVYQDNNYTNEYLGENGWQKDPAEIPGAIYFNKAGFNKKESVHSKDWSGRSTPVTDEITLTPSGYSGHLYPTHTTNGMNIAQPDVNELAIVLPSIGDTVASMWDLIYGDKEINDKSSKRNTVIRWEDAKDILAKEGLRLVRNLDHGYGYTYNDDEVNTLAGAINSVQDIMGMIITDDYPDDVDNLNENYIYYDKSKGKYYFKKRTYTYEKVDGDVSYEPIPLEDWEKNKDKYWWIDTNNTIPDYIQEASYRPDRRYVSGVNVPTDPILARHFSATEYKPGEFYIRLDKEPGTDNDFLESTGAKYHKYIKTKESYDVNSKYYKITETAVTLNPDAIYYVPNKYYEAHFTKLVPEVVDEEDFERRLAEGVRIFRTVTTDSTYGLRAGTELKSGDFQANALFTKDFWALTLKTCSMTEEEYREKQQQKKDPMLFATSAFKPGAGMPQNYYVMTEKYEWLDGEGWMNTISNSPGVYYFIEVNNIEEGKTVKDYVKDYVDDQGLLKTAYANNQYLQLEENIHIEDNHLYFRKIVELVLSSAENVVNIADAKQITVESLEPNLYQKLTGGEEEGYKSVSALSDIFVNKTNYGEIQGLCKIEPVLLEIGYEPEVYYYQVQEGDRKNSLVIDNRLEPTKDRDYWTVNLVNKRTLTAAEIDAGRQPNIDYYIRSNDDYEIYTGALKSGKTYFVSSLEEAPDFYYPNKYYYKNDNGEFVLDMSQTITPGREYYNNPYLYIYNDPNGMYTMGASWPLGQKPPADSGIELALRKDAWELAELEGFDITFNTLHGLILRLNQMMLQGDVLTRDENTLQGMMNKLNDLIHRFGSMAPGQFMMVDNAGRMHGVTYSTKQDFSAVNHGKPGAVEIVKTEADANGEDRWIDVDSDDDFRGPSLTIKHNFTQVKDTTTTSDMNNPKTDTVELYTPIVDNKGHIVGKNTETVTMPFGFKTITASNVNEAIATQATPVANKDIVADNTQDVFNLIAGNKWIQMVTNDASDTLTISHRALTDATTASTSVIMDQGATEDIRNNIGPFVHNIDLDEAGHVTKEHFISYTLPNAYQILKVDNNQVTTAQNTHDTLLIQGDEWLTPTILQGSLKYSHNKFAVVVPEVTNKTMDDLTGNERNVFGPVVSGMEYDEAGHLTKINQVSYKLPNSYQTLTSGEGQVSTAINAYDTLTIKGDSWLKPTVTQGTLTYEHINNNMLQDFVAAGNHTLGAQTPQFGNTFNMQTYSLDANGHIIGKSTETVLIPTDIRGLLLTSFSDENSKYLVTGMTLETALATLDETIHNVQTNVNNNYAEMEEGYLALQDVIDDEVAALREELKDCHETLRESDVAILDAIDEQAAIAAETYALLEGNINKDTTFTYTEEVPESIEIAEDGTEIITPAIPETRVGVQEAIEILSHLDKEAVRSDQTFIYTPEIPEESHEATQEEVDAGLATTIGEKIIDVEYVPAEQLTIQDLFNKVKALEMILLNS